MQGPEERATLLKFLEDFNVGHRDKEAFDVAIRSIPSAREALEFLKKSLATRALHSGTAVFGTVRPKSDDRKEFGLA